MLANLVKQVVMRLQINQYTLATAESCTGGGILKVLTDFPGSSTVTWGGIVAYTDEAKVKLLSVAPSLLEKEGAVSSEVAKAMVQGVQNLSDASFTVSTTGFAGPGGGDPENPVGTVWMAWGAPKRIIDTQKFIFCGDRTSVREKSIAKALQGILVRLDRC